MLQARVLFEQEHGERAVGVIRDFVDGFGATSLQLLVLAGFLGQLGQAEEAIKLIEKAQEHDHTADVTYLFRLVDACTKIIYGGELTPPESERIDKVVGAAFEKLAPTVRSLLTLSNLRIAQERFEDVEKLYRQVLELSADNVVALNNLAVLLALKKKDLNEAVKMIDRAIELGGQNGTLLDSRATIYLANGQAGGGLQSIQKAIAASESPTRYFHLAQVQDGLRKPKEAAKALAKAQDLGLTAEMLHPLERAEYDRLLALLDK
jgi:tetratricopeptide (TPR) repeat protein